MAWTRMWSRAEGAQASLPRAAWMLHLTVFLHLLVYLLHSPSGNSLSLASVTCNSCSHVTLAYTRLSWPLWFLLTSQTFCFSLIANYTLPLAFLGSSAIERESDGHSLFFGLAALDPGVCPRSSQLLQFQNSGKSWPLRPKYGYLAATLNTGVFCHSSVAGVSGFCSWFCPV